MPVRSLFAVASASLLLLANAAGSSGGPTSPTTKYTVSLGSDGACLAEINAARKNASFGYFILPQSSDKTKRLPAEGEKTSDQYTGWVWKPVCDALIPGESTAGQPAAESEAFASGTYAYQVVDIPDSVNCTAVVDTWQKAYTNFDGLPPPKKDSKDLYTKQENVSLVAMYNPSNNATADCRIVTCTKTVTSGTESLLVDNEEDGSGDGTTKKETNGYALICMTTPDVLSAENTTAPFTEEQWGNIVSSIKGSASAVLPSLLGLVAAVFGLVVAM